MLSFHNDINVKNKYVARISAHIEADHLVQGTGWCEEDQKGCAVGCTLENYDHSRYPIELGFPGWIARLEDSLFEGMSLAKSKTWPLLFLESIPLGLSEERFEKDVKAPFLVMVLKRLLGTVNLDGFDDVKASVQGSISLWERDDIGSSDWKDAARAAAHAAHAAHAACAAAYAAARAAADTAHAACAAAYAAAYAAARAAAHAAYAAAYAAAHAACAAAYAAADTAHAETYDYYADELIKLLSGLKER